MKPMVIRAEHLVSVIEDTWNGCISSIPQDRELRLYLTMPLEKIRVSKLHWIDGNLLLVTAVPDDEGVSDVLYVPVESAVLQIRNQKLSPERPREIVGFGKG